MGAIDRIAKQGDADRYVAALFVPPSARQHLLALLSLIHI